jgi:hypothetical protein
VRKRLRKIGVVIILAFVCVWSGLYGMSLYHRHKAVRLLREVQAVSTVVDVQSLLDRKRYKWAQDCTRDSCSYTAVIENLGPFQILAKTTAWDYVGIRPWVVRATIDVSAGKIARLEYFADLGRGRGDLHRIGPLGTPIWAWIAADTILSDGYFFKRTEIYRKSGFVTPNDFLVTKPCVSTYGGGEDLSIIASTKPSKPAFDLAFDMNLSCLTAFRPCTELCQLRSKVWARFLAEGAHGCNLDEEALARARRACGDWAGRVGNAGKPATGN